MKKLLVVILILGAILAAAPIIVGIETETHYQEFVARIENNGFKVLDHQYQRGWLGAEAETRLQMSNSAGTGERQSQTPRFGFLLKSDIAHGPMTADGLGLAAINSQVHPLPGGALPESYSGKLHTFVALDGKGKTELSWPPETSAVGNSGDRASFGGLDGEILFDPNEERVNWDLMIPEVRFISSEGVAVGFSGLGIDSRSWESQSGLTLGEGTLTLREISFSDGMADDTLRIEGFGLKVESSERNERVAAVADYSLSGLTTGDQVFGPGRIRLTLDQLSAEGLLRLQESISHVQRQPMAELQRRMATMSALMSVAPALLETDPKVTIDPLRLSTPDGVVDGRFSLASEGMTWDQVTSGAQALEKLSGSLSIKMPEAVFERLLEGWILSQLKRERLALGEQLDDGQNEEQIQNQAKIEAQSLFTSLVRQQFVVHGNGEIATVAALSSGLLTINGKVFPLVP